MSVPNATDGGANLSLSSSLPFTLGQASNLLLRHGAGTQSSLNPATMALLLAQQRTTNASTNSASSQQQQQPNAWAAAALSNPQLVQQLLGLGYPATPGLASTRPVWPTAANGFAVPQPSQSRPSALSQMASAAVAARSSSASASAALPVVSEAASVASASSARKRKYVKKASKSVMSKEEADEMLQLKKHKHREVEIRRRRRLNDCFTQLSKLCGNTATKKRAILQNAMQTIQTQTRYIQVLEQNILQMSQNGASPPASSSSTVLGQFSYASVPICIVSVHGNVLALNDEFTKLLGYTQSDLLRETQPGQQPLNIFGMVCPDDMAGMLSFLHAVLGLGAGTAVKRHSNRMISKARKLIPVEHTVWINRDSTGKAISMALLMYPMAMSKSIDKFVPDERILEQLARKTAMLSKIAPSTTSSNTPPSSSSSSSAMASTPSTQTSNSEDPAVSTAVSALSAMASLPTTSSSSSGAVASMAAGSAAIRSMAMGIAAAAASASSNADTSDSTPGNATHPKSSAPQSTQA